MIHRATWMAAFTVGVLGAGVAAGYWGYTQQQQKQAFAMQAQVQYQSAFHNLVNNVSEVRSELAKTLLTSDHDMFDSHLSNVSRLAFAAEADLARIPQNASQTSHIHTFLNEVQQDASHWMQVGETPQDKGVKREINTYYSQSGTLLNQLDSLEINMRGQHSSWIADNSTSASTLASTGMKKIDTDMATFTRAKTKPAGNMTQGQTNLSKAQMVTAEQAVKIAGAAMNAPGTAGWTAKLEQANKPEAYFSITGKVNGNEVSAEVSQIGGKLIDFYNHRPVRTSSYDFAKSSVDALSWLQKHGFTTVRREDSGQYDHTATFTFVPTIQGIPVIDQPIQVDVALDNGEVTGFNATQVYQKQVKNVPGRKLSSKQLAGKLSPDFRVQFHEPIIVQNAEHQYVPAEAFYGTLKQETFRVILNAQNGTEIQSEALT